MAVIGRHCSATERNSESAERELRKYLVLELLSTKLGEDFPGTVTGVTGQGIYLQIDQFLIDGFIRTPDLPGDKGDRWQLNRNTGALVAQRSGRIINIGDRFPKIRIASVDLSRRQMELVIIEERDGKRGGKKKSGNGKTKNQSPPAKAATHEGQPPKNEGGSAPKKRRGKRGGQKSKSGEGNKSGGDPKSGRGQGGNDKPKTDKASRTRSQTLKLKKHRGKKR